VSGYLLLIGQSPPHVRATFTSTSTGTGAISGASASTIAAFSQAAAYRL
jgi:hypothetical protein